MRHSVSALVGPIRRPRDRRRDDDRDGRVDALDPDRLAVGDENRPLQLAGDLDEVGGGGGAGGTTVLIASGLGVASVDATFPAAVDCNDDDADVFPNAVEVCDDGLDNDCDGSADATDNDCAEAGCASSIAAASTAPGWALLLLALVGGRRRRRYRRVRVPHVSARAGAVGETSSSSVPGRKMAEREGFEPSVTCATHDFQSCTFDHSVTSPDHPSISASLAAP